MAIGVLGTTGQTAYFGMLDLGEPKAGQTVVVSGAAGSVGSMVGQLGKAEGLRVVGIDLLVAALLQQPAHDGPFWLPQDEPGTHHGTDGEQFQPFPQNAVVAAEVIVMPRSCSCSIQSIVAAPSWTSPIL